MTRSDIDDLKKLQGVLQYVKGTIDNKRIIKYHDITNIVTFVDASYAVYEEMRSHTGDAITVGQGMVHNKSSKQRLNVKSSSEAEVVGVSDYISYALWFKHFSSH